MHIYVLLTLLFFILLSDTPLNCDADTTTTALSDPPLQQKPRVLIMQEDMSDKLMPTNIRVMDMTRLLVACGYNVTVFCRSVYGFAAEFRQELDELQVEWIYPVPDFEWKSKFRMKAYMEQQQQPFDLVFMYLWFWGYKSVPELYYTTIAKYNPNARIFTLTDDAHSLRNSLIISQVLFSGLDTDDIAFFPIHHRDVFGPNRTQMMKTRELEVYNVSEHVFTATESDATQLLNIGVHSASVLRFSHNLTQIEIPTEVPPFSPRSGMLFIGYGANPTNRLALTWLFRKVWPYLSDQFKGTINNGQFVANATSEPIYLIGSQPPDKYKHLRIPPEANVIMVPKQNASELVVRLNQARLMFSPVIAATGIITKNLFAMSLGLPVVATRRSVEGLYWHDQNELFESAFAIANDCEEYARKLENVYYNEEEWNARSLGILALARAQFSTNNPRSFSPFEQDIVDYFKIPPQTCSARKVHVYDYSKEKYSLKDDRDENGDFSGRFRGTVNDPNFDARQAIDSDSNSEEDGKEDDKTAEGSDGGAQQQQEQEYTLALLIAIVVLGFTTCLLLYMQQQRTQKHNKQKQTRIARIKRRRA